MPASGPSSTNIYARVPRDGIPYALVRLTPGVVRVLAEYGSPSISHVFGDARPPPEIKLGIGDVVSVTIFEAAAGGLFIPIEAGVRPGNFVTLPNQQIDSKGMISVPFAGLIKAAGRRPSQVEAAIVNALKSRAVDPQAIVSLVNQNSSLVSVVGEVNATATAAARVPAVPAGERILDYIARAGGVKDQGQNTWVVLERGGVRASVPFGALISDPANNIWVWPGDTIYLYQEPQTFLAFGASGQQGQFPFNQWRLSLAEAVAIAGGLLDTQAGGSVFLYRYETRALAERLGVNCARFNGPAVPIIYSVSFRDPGSYFLATRVQMRNKDVLFAANAHSVELTKIANFINSLTSVVSNVAGTGVNIQTWRLESRNQLTLPLTNVQ